MPSRLCRWASASPHGQRQRGLSHLGLGPEGGSMAQVGSYLGLGWLMGPRFGLGLIDGAYESMMIINQYNLGNWGFL